MVSTEREDEPVALPRIPEVLAFRQAVTHLRDDIRAVAQINKQDAADKAVGSTDRARLLSISIANDLIADKLGHLLERHPITTGISSTIHTGIAPEVDKWQIVTDALRSATNLLENHEHRLEQIETDVGKLLDTSITDPAVTWVAPDRCSICGHDYNEGPHAGSAIARHNAMLLPIREQQS